MSVQNTKRNGLTLPPDMLAKRLRWAVIASILLNIIGWRGVAAMAKRPMYVSPRPVEITRVIIDNKGHKIEKKILKEQIKKRVAQIKKLPPPRVIPVAYHPPARPAEQPVRSNVLTARTKGPGNGDPEILPGNGAPLGKPIEQSPTVVKPAPEPVKPAPEPVKPAPEPVKPAPEPVKPAPEPIKPAPEPVKPAPEPVKAPEPLKKGPTRDSEPAEEIKPEIPDELKHGEFKSFVRVKIEIDAEGKPNPILRSSSGNAEIDRRVLNALRKWRWKPALENGVPVASVQLFKFEFLVE